MFDDWEQRLGMVLGTEKDEDNEICLPMVSKRSECKRSRSELCFH